jgi:hypothetical protein
MAYIAFDLDNTLGFFELTNPMAFLWSPDFLENPEQSSSNTRLEISAKLHNKLKRARQHFANHLLEDNELLSVILRPNLDIMFSQILEARKQKRIKAVIIYSNTGVTYSMELAKYLIEKKYKAPNLISLMADHWHPLRVADRPRYIPEGRYVQPEKTIKTLQVLFKAATGQTITPEPKKILFVDDRNPKHRLQEQEPEGLTYIVPTSFYPRITDHQRRALLFLAFESLHSCNLLNDNEYLSSGFCHRNISLMPFHLMKKRQINGFPSLLMHVSQEISGVESSNWEPDTIALESQVHAFFKRIKG